MRKITVRCTFDIQVDVPDDEEEGYNSQEDIEENHCPGTGVVGAAFDRVYLACEKKNTCWACELNGKNEIIFPLREKESSMREVAPEIMRLIDVLAEAKMHVLLTAHTREGTDEREAELKLLGECTHKARELVDAMGGVFKLPGNLAVNLRVCELGLERLGGPKAPPHEVKNDR